MDLDFRYSPSATVHLASHIPMNPAPASWHWSLDMVGLSVCGKEIRGRDLIFGFERRLFDGSRLGSRPGPFDA
jgi:hypothetical protein